jgi:hypothetical protein
MLTILNELGKWCDKSTGAFDLDAFKIVYVAFMKALVQEMVGNINPRLGPFGIKSRRAYWRLTNDETTNFRDSNHCDCVRSGMLSRAKSPTPHIPTLFTSSSLMKSTSSMMNVVLFLRVLS